MSKISWTEKTWNPVVGCSKLSEGCENCYAEKMAKRLAAMGKEGYCYVTTKEGRWNGNVFHLFSKNVLEQPLGWKKPRQIFVCSMGDLFHKDVPFSFIAKVFFMMGICYWHKFQVLTKRIDRALEFLTIWHKEKNKGYFFNPDFGPYVEAWVGSGVEILPKEYHQRLTKMQYHYVPDWKGESAKNLGEAGYFIPWPLPNVHIGVSCENQRTADERMPLLLQIPAAKKFVSFEPLLGEIDVTPFIEQGYNVCFNCGWYGKDEELPEHNGLPALPCPKCDDDTYAVPIDELIDQVIIGAESLGGHAGRECKLAWVRSLVAQAQSAGVKIHVKQLHLWGTNKDNAIYKTTQEAQLRLGEYYPRRFLVKDIKKFPEDLRIRETL